MHLLSWELTALPQTPWLWGRGGGREGEGKGKEGKEARRGKGREREGRGKGGEGVRVGPQTAGPDPPSTASNARALARPILDGKTHVQWGCMRVQNRINWSSIKVM